MLLDDRINGKTKLIGLLGNPVEHTVSPQLHNTLSGMLGVDSVYIPIKVERNSLETAVSGLKACNFSGFNTTIPFKEEILKYVDEFTDEVKITGSANTVKIKNGRLFAYSTDAEGFVRSFEEQAHTGFKGKNVVIIGAGGTARAIAVKIAANDAAGIFVANRTIQKAADIAAIVNSTGGAAEVVSLVNMNENAVIGDFDVIINTTPLGMYPNIHESPLKDSIKLDSNQIVYDVHYNPAKTKLLKQAESYGCIAINGLGMLFYQGILAYEIWMDIKIADNIVKELYNKFSGYFGG